MKQSKKEGLEEYTEVEVETEALVIGGRPVRHSPDSRVILARG